MTKIFLFFVLLLIPITIFSQDAPIDHTTHYGLREWEENANPSADSLNQNWKDIDQELYDLIVTTDTSNLIIKNDTLMLNVPYGEIYINEDDAQTVSISAMDTYYAITDFIALMAHNATNAVSTITVSSPGIYIVDYHLDIDVSTAMTILVHCFKNSTEQEALGTYVKIGSGDIESISVTGLVSCNADDALSLKIKCTDATGNATFRHGSLVIHKIGNLQ